MAASEHFASWDEVQAEIERRRRAVGSPQQEAEKEAARRLRAPGALPCLQCNNSITDPGEASKPRETGPKSGETEAENPAPVASKQYVKSAVALTWNVKALADRFGIHRLGFLTLTFADHVVDPREAQRRFNSLASNVLRQRYVEHIRVVERQKSGRIHYHLLVVLNDDIRTGFDFAGIARHDYRSASIALRAEWDFWRKTSKAYGFGRTELLPIKSTDVAIARYVGKYISKHVAAREERDKGIRLVEYSRGARMASTRYQFNTAGSAIWRLQLELFARIVAEEHGLAEVGLADLAELLGARWAYANRHFIRQLPVDIPPGREHWFAQKMGQGGPREALDGL